jgi:RNA polymerase sigma-70 factor (ECF subfamily)
MNGSDTRDLSDEQLATRFAETRDDACFEEIVRRYQGKLRAGAFAVLGDRSLAEDVTQRSFLRLIMAGDRFSEGNLGGWLYRVTRNLAFNLYVQRKRRGTLEEQFAGETRRNGLSTPTSDSRVAEVMAELPAPQRICLNLFYGSELTYKSIAQETGFSLKEVKTHLQNGRRNFKQHWGKRERNGG